MLLLPLIEHTTRALLRIAPPAFRAAWRDQMVTTIREACLEARARRGAAGLLFAGIVELSNVGDSAIRARLGRLPRLSGGRPPSSSSPRDRGHGAYSMHRLIHDLRLALRSLRAARSVVAIAVLTLALGIGVNAAVFSILDSAVFRPVPFADADRLDELWTFDAQSKFSYPGFSDALLGRWREQTDVFDRVEGYDITSFVYTAPQGAEMITGAYVTPGLMSMLGIPPLHGRWFGEGDGRGGTDTRVVISEDLWRREFQADRDVVGRRMTLNGREYDVVGVMPASFRFPNGAATFWVPFDAAAPPAGGPRPRRLTAFTRRAPGVTHEQAEALVEARAPALATAAGEKASITAKFGSAFGVIDGKLERSLYVLGGAVAFLLLIVCANLANLSLSRTLTRARDFAVRASLGASRRDLMRETLVEHLLIGVAGAVLGLAVARGVLALTLAMMPQGALVRSMNAIDLDARTLAFTALVGLGAALLFGLPPAWFASRAGVAAALKDQSRSSTGSAAARRLRGVLVVAEVTLALVLLVGAALMARSFVKLYNTDRGFDTRGLAVLRLGLPANGYRAAVARDGFTDEMIDRLSKLAGVRGASAGGVPPDSSLIRFASLEFADRPGRPTDDLILPIYEVWSNYFDVVGIPIREGRAFGPDESRDSVIVNESFARQYFPNGGAVGAQFRFDTDRPWQTIVGVAGEVRQFDLDDANGSAEFYYPLRRPAAAAAAASTPPASTEAIVDYRTFVVRADDADGVLMRLRALAHDVDPRVVVWRTDTVDRLFADALARPRLVLLLMSVFAALGLVLAAAGIYGVLSYLVAQRRREIGIRLALGAMPRSVGRLVLRDGLRLTVLGLTIGLAAALALVRVMQTLLYEVEPSDPLSLAAVALVLLATATLASWWPARRAMRINPLALLRED